MAQPLIRPDGVVDGTAPAPPSRRLLGPAALVSVAFLGANALAYAFTLVAARLLVPAAFGELAALLGVLLVGTVPATGLQTAAALHLGGVAGRRSPLVLARLHASALVTALVVVIAGALAAAPLTALLHLPDPLAVVWLVALLVPSTLVSGYQGMLQGTGRYGQLAAVNGFLALAKLLGGTAGLLVGGTPTAALAGMTVAALVAALAGWAACGRPGVARGLRTPLTAALRASGALLGFVLLLNLDLLLARHHLTAGHAGEYAVGSIVTKIAFWLPQGVGVVLLPRLADEAHRRRSLPSALAVVAGVGAVLTLGTAALGSAALPLVGGSAYGDALGTAASLFAALGTGLALAQLLLYSGIAAADRVAVGSVWVAAVIEAVVVSVLSATGRLTVVSLAGTAVLTAVLLVGAGLLRTRPLSPER
ncbi:polysaccharide biosynthesis protein [Blastococcus haudaquaticus]|uniref:Membrane protein involved in the export of O-antigen and teichoic acid n=1 Tax=Blastococcus haudaquaticus TaxID=1938745 RepID=A0A286GSI0_9ACTN|nr:polysaccharide biosynthesis protein [Blastococcus haudaquaticus]SOD98527.1 Membrane protein involved in the export of O-antigen and teichoic acid [Blastococcus haudaquaticus]